MIIKKRLFWILFFFFGVINDISAQTILKEPFYIKGQPLSVRLEWEDNCTDWQVLVSTDASFSNVVASAYTSDHYYVISNLINNTKYYWKLGADYGSGYVWSVVASFTTDAKPATPSLKGPILDQQNVSVTPAFYWRSVSAAHTYCLQIATDPSFGTGMVLFADSSIGDTICQLDFKKIILDYRTKYFWRVKGVNRFWQLSTWWSSTFSFTTGSKLEQSEFITIGAWNGPTFNGVQKDDSISVQRFKDANFNTILTSPLVDKLNYSDIYFTNAAITVPKSLSGYKDSDFWNSTATASNEYQLSILKTVGSVSKLVADRTVLYFNNWKPDSCSMRMNDVALVYSTISSCRDNMLGYFIKDEPRLSEIPELNLKLNALASADISKIAYYNLGSSFVANSWTDYKDYVDQYIGNPNTKVVSFDNYCFDIGHGIDATRTTMTNWVEDLTKARYINGYPSALGPDIINSFGYPAIYAHLELFASKIKYYKETRNKNTLFWGAAGCSEEHYVYDEIRNNHPISIRHMAYPTEQILRFYVSSNLMYGSKGIIWYTYSRQDTLAGATITNPSPPSVPAQTKEDFAVKAASNDTVIYNNLKKVNGEIVKMAPVLLRLEWQRTIHGKRIDPSSNEPLLDTLDSYTPFYYNYSRNDAIQRSSIASATWSFDSMAVGLFKYGKFDCLVIMNKSVYLENHTTHQFKGYANSTKYIVKSNVFPRIFDKTNGGWSMIKNRLYNKEQNTTSFELPHPIAPGDMELVWLGPADITPVINLLLD